MTEQTALERQRATCVRLLVELADWLDRVDRPADRACALELRAFVLRYANAEKTIRHWPADGPISDDPRDLAGIAAALEKHLHTTVEQTKRSYTAGELDFGAVDRVVRGMVD